MRIKIVVAYDGTAYYGWQIQRGFPTIESNIEAVLKHICGKETKVTGAGRTDTGVHAYGQVAHFDWDYPLQMDKLLLGLNALLPDDIRVCSLEEVDPKFHSRYDAKSKTYLYRIDRSRVYDPFTYRYALYYPFPLNLDLMTECASMIEGTHDFAGFQATGTDIIGTERTVFNVKIENEKLLSIRVHATGFLRKMMRFLVGTMVEIAAGKRPLNHLRKALDTQDRSYVGVPAAARGLFLERVYYD